MLAHSYKTLAELCERVPASNANVTMSRFVSALDPASLNLATHTEANLSPTALKKEQQAVWGEITQVAVAQGLAAAATGGAMGNVRNSDDMAAAQATVNNYSGLLLGVNNKAKAATKATKSAP